MEENLKSIPAIEAETDEDSYVMAVKEKRRKTLTGRTADHEYRKEYPLNSHGNRQ